jgi:hypothetical protein
MIDDFRPSQRPKAKSLRATLDTLNRVSTPSKAPKTNTDSFRTPEEVAAAQTLKVSTGPELASGAPQSKEPSAGVSGSESAVSTKRSPQFKKLHALWQKFDLSWPPGKKELLIIGISLILLTGIVSAILLTHSGSKPIATAHKVIKIKKLPPKPTTVPSTLSGLPVDPAVNARPVTGVMIENSTDARPQSGLASASVVFEAIAEGGVTRFLALYQDTTPDNVGPIRSARPYYIQWDLGFDAAYAHVGGSPDGLADIKAWGVKDLDQFANGGSYHRITTRQAPHNVYTAISTLNQLEASKGYTTSTFTGFPRKAEAPTKQPPTAKSIDLTLSGPVYNAHYDYTAATNSYNRSEGGAGQIDANTNAQISPKVVIAMVVPETQGALDATGAYYSNYAAIGSGSVSVFQDGTVTTGQWTKASSTAQLTFTNAAGQPLTLNPGQTWITAVKTANNIVSTP